MRLLAPAKINLHLRVGSSGADGFHPLLSWMCSVGFFDMMTISPAGKGSPLVQMTCDDPTLACDATNLIVRVGTVLAEAIGGTTREGDDARKSGMLTAGKERSEGLA